MFLALSCLRQCRPWCQNISTGALETWRKSDSAKTSRQAKTVRPRAPHGKGEAWDRKCFDDFFLVIKTLMFGFDKSLVLCMCMIPLIDVTCDALFFNDRRYIIYFYTHSICIGLFIYLFIYFCIFLLDLDHCNLYDRRVFKPMRPEK